MARREMTMDLGHWMSLGFGCEVTPLLVGKHRSKSIELPIVGGSVPHSNVEVTWFGDNFHFHFLGVALRNPVLATLLYPISRIFGDYALSGHVNAKIAPPVQNFEKAYHNLERFKRFGGDCGGQGFGAALAIRYLREVSKLDPERVLDICFRKTSRGAVERIDGNWVSFEDLSALLGFDTERFFYYDFDVKTIPTDVFERINIDWFDRRGGCGSVHVTMAKGVLLPYPSSLPAEVYVDPRDTQLAQYLPEEVQKRRAKKHDRDFILDKIPARTLNYRDSGPREYGEKLRSLPYPIHPVYSRVNMDTREFTFAVPNVLDCALTAFFLIRVVAPLLREMRAN